MWYCLNLSEFSEDSKFKFYQYLTSITRRDIRQPWEEFMQKFPHITLFVFIQNEQIVNVTGQAERKWKYPDLPASYIKKILLNLIISTPK